MVKLLNGRRGEPVNSKAYLNYELKRLEKRNAELEIEFYQSGNLDLKEEILLNQGAIKRINDKLKPSPVLSKIERLKSIMTNKKK